jgi:hypothetical protein
LAMGLAKIDNAHQNCLTASSETLMHSARRFKRAV